MSRATKRKHVTREVVEDEVELIGDQLIVKVTCGRGNNLHQVECNDGSKFLVSMPTKFRKNVWIKRGDYVVVDPIREGHKVQAEIVHILYPMQIKALKQQGLWPCAFIEEVSSSRLPPVVKEKCGSSSDESSSDDEDLFKNTNRPPDMMQDISSSDQDSDIA